jgi:hypothetical protein
MLSSSPATRIFVALEPVDMRAGFNRLYALVETRLHQPPLSSHPFVFTNRLRNRVKVLYFDGSGLWACAKRLERGGRGSSRGIHRPTGKPSPRGQLPGRIPKVAGRPRDRLRRGVCVGLERVVPPLQRLPRKRGDCFRTPGRWPISVNLKFVVGWKPAKRAASCGPRRKPWDKERPT